MSHVIGSQAEPLGPLQVLTFTVIAATVVVGLLMLNPTTRKSIGDKIRRPINLLFERRRKSLAERAEQAKKERRRARRQNVRKKAAKKKLAASTSGTADTAPIDDSNEGCGTASSSDGAKFALPTMDSKSSLRQARKAAAAAEAAAKAEAKAKLKADRKAEANARARARAEARAAARARARAEAEVEAKAKAEAKAAEIAEWKATAKANAEAKAEAKRQAEAKVAAEDAAREEASVAAAGGWDVAIDKVATPPKLKTEPLKSAKSPPPSGIGADGRVRLKIDPFAGKALKKKQQKKQQETDTDTETETETDTETEAEEKPRKQTQLARDAARLGLKAVEMGYNKKKSFFDTISCSAVETKKRIVAEKQGNPIAPKPSGQITEKELNKKTFGSLSLMDAARQYTQGPMNPAGDKPVVWRGGPLSASATPYIGHGGLSGHISRVSPRGTSPREVALDDSTRPPWDNNPPRNSNNSNNDRIIGGPSSARGHTGRTDSIYDFPPHRTAEYLKPRRTSRSGADYAAERPHTTRPRRKSRSGSRDFADFGRTEVARRTSRSKADYEVFSQSTRGAAPRRLSRSSVDFAPRRTSWSGTDFQRRLTPTNDPAEYSGRVSPRDSKGIPAGSAVTFAAGPMGSGFAAAPGGGIGIGSGSGGIAAPAAAAGQAIGSLGSFGGNTFGNYKPFAGAAHAATQATGFAPNGQATTAFGFGKYLQLPPQAKTRTSRANQSHNWRRRTAAEEEMVTACRRDAEAEELKAKVTSKPARTTSAASADSILSMLAHCGSPKVGVKVPDSPTINNLLSPRHIDSPTSADKKAAFAFAPNGGAGWKLT